MKNEENHGFTSFDFLTMMFSFAVIVAVSAPIVRQKFGTDPNVEVARQQASLLGQSLLDPRNLNSMAGGAIQDHSRSIASISSEDKQGVPVDLASLKDHLKNGEWEGDLGKDPWGSPYHFAFIRNLQGTPTHVIVWSDGPNHKNETSSALKSQMADPGQLKFGGDDLGTVSSIR